MTLHLTDRSDKVLPQAKWGQITMIQSPGILQEMLQSSASRFPSCMVHIFDRRGLNAERRTICEIIKAAEEFAKRMAGLGVQPKEPVLISLATSQEWLDLWFGALFTGAFPVAIALPGAFSSTAAHLRKIEGISNSLGIRFLFSNSAMKGLIANEQAWAGPQCYTHGELAQCQVNHLFKRPTMDPEDIAFLQLTSGSTGVSRAVMISHTAATVNPFACSSAIGEPYGGPVHELADALVSWLPLYHDMGLISCLLLPMLSGLDAWLFKPETFLARPHLWLEQISNHRFAFSPAPNFAYQLCVERVQDEKMNGIDLSPWKSALVGAETVRPETVDQFCKRFSNMGFNPNHITPCYGLAEATLGVTVDLKGRGIRSLANPETYKESAKNREIVCLGEPVPDTELKITSPNGTDLKEGRVGELQVRGPGVFSGYFQDDQATAGCLNEGWLRTGDLGFLQNGELYLTGRLKDILIIHGHNVMPDELEQIAYSITGGGGRNRTAAFSIPGESSERPVLLIETDERDPKKLQMMEQEVKREIGRALAMNLADLLFLKRGKISKTSSGKVRRQEMRRIYLHEHIERII